MQVEYKSIVTMIRIYLFLQIFLLFTFYSCHATYISKADRNVLQKFWQYANKHKLSEKVVSERIPSIALFFINTTYKSNTLNVTQKELPIINLRELDCVTFIENVLALSLLSEYSYKSIDDFVNNIIKIRYRDRKIEDYTSRLHYSSDWIYEMERQEILTDITQFTGGIKLHQQINFMSKNYGKYPPLKNNLKLRAKIKDIETSINKRTYHYIPKTKVNKSYHMIKSGDILLITTTIKGLDTSHMGFALKQKGKTYLLHASSDKRKVVISEQPLQEYLEENRTQSGVMVGRSSKNIPQ